ncbi:hypothetical protein CSUI_011051 [Cystoisospora suis]|uniref:C3H1-type domain-containing protein n=1 Tax=Cystoisospora suis TaxID=483139 RepID=A0A2C6KER1_9APIC|nr:hypothetical protein CSUI_011051 [Cystoisospora suis]
MNRKTDGQPGATKGAPGDSIGLCCSQNAGSPATEMFATLFGFSEPLDSQPNSPDGSYDEDGLPAEWIRHEATNSIIVPASDSAPARCQPQGRVTVAENSTENSPSLSNEAKIGANGDQCQNAAVIAAATTALLLLQRKTQHEAKERRNVPNNHRSPRASPAPVPTQQGSCVVPESQATSVLKMPDDQQTETTSEVSCAPPMLSGGVQPLASLIRRLKQQQPPSTSGGPMEALLAVAETATLLEKALDISPRVPLCFQPVAGSIAITHRDIMDREAATAYRNRDDKVSAGVSPFSIADTASQEKPARTVGCSFPKWMNWESTADAQQKQVSTARHQQGKGLLLSPSLDTFHHPCAASSRPFLRQTPVSIPMLSGPTAEARAEQGHGAGPFQAVTSTQFSAVEAHHGDPAETVQVLRSSSRSVFESTTRAGARSGEVSLAVTRIPDFLHRSAAAFSATPPATPLSGSEPPVLTGQLLNTGLRGRYESILSERDEPGRDRRNVNADTRANRSDEQMPCGLRMLRKRLGCDSASTGSHCPRDRVHMQRPDSGADPACHQRGKGHSPACHRALESGNWKPEGRFGCQSTWRARPFQTGTHARPLASTGKAPAAFVREPGSQEDSNVTRPAFCHDTTSDTVGPAPLTANLTLGPLTLPKHFDVNDLPGRPVHRQKFTPGLESTDTCDVAGLFPQRSNGERYPATTCPRAANESHATAPLHGQAPHRHLKSLYRRLSHDPGPNSLCRSDRLVTSQGRGVANAIAALSALLTSSTLFCAKPDDSYGVSPWSADHYRPGLLTTEVECATGKRCADLPHTVAQRMEMEFHSQESSGYEAKDTKPPQYPLQLQHSDRFSRRRLKLQSREQEISDSLCVSVRSRSRGTPVAPPPGVNEEPGCQCIKNQKSAGAAVRTAAEKTPSVSATRANAGLQNMPSVGEEDSPPPEAMCSTRVQGAQQDNLCLADILGFQELLSHSRGPRSAYPVFGDTGVCGAAFSTSGEAEQTAAPSPLPRDKQNTAHIPETGTHVVSRDPLCPCLSDALSKNSGSTRHPKECRPCAFFWGRGCHNGLACRFCHEEHGPRKKKPMKDQKNLMIIARPDGRLEFIRCRLKEALNACG